MQERPEGDDPYLPAVQLDRTRHLAIYLRRRDRDRSPLSGCSGGRPSSAIGTLLMVDDERFPLAPNEEVVERSIRFRTLGCYPLTGAIESEAATLPEVIQEMVVATTSERQGRVIDNDGGSGSMEKKKQEGYF